MYIDDYVQFGFTFIENNGVINPQCVICHVVLSNDALRPSRMERNLTTAHPILKEKSKKFFENMFDRVYELNSKVEIMRLQLGKDNLHENFTDENCTFYFAYLADIFEVKLFEVGLKLVIWIN